MNARYSQGCILSCLLHGTVVAAVLLLAYLSDQAGLEKPKVFELVAGEGDNYAATEAPAIGVPGGVKAVVPPAATPPPAVETPPSPPAEETPPPVPAAVEPAPEPVPVPAPHPTKAKPVPDKNAVPNFTKQVQRTAHRRAARLETKYRKELEAQRKRETYEQYLKEHGGPSDSHSRADPEGIRHGVIGGSTANKTGGAGGKAMSREESSLLDAYFALLKARSHENFEPPTDVSEKLVARVSFFVAADGSISRVHIVRSSGNAAFDQAVLEAFHRTRSIGPRPDHRGDEVVLAFRLREEDAP